MKHAAIIAALDEMLSNGYYAARKHGLAAARTIILAQARRISDLERTEAALDEWFEKTDWTQAQIDSFHGRTLGLHRADVLKNEIEYLRSREESARELLRRLKRDLMSARLHQPDVLATYRRTCTSAESDIETFFKEQP